MAYENLVVAEEYESQGEKKTKFTTIGKLITKADGKQSVKIDVVPLNWNGWANVMKPKDKGQSQRPPDEQSGTEPF